MTRQLTISIRSLDEVENPMRAADGLSPAERIGLVWELTSQALEFRGEVDVERRLSRHLVRAVGLRG